MNDDIKKELNDALTMLSVIALSGDALDVMAAAKSKIRKAVVMLEPKEVEDNGR